jgi:V/A-type H+-transporting ATPase subunit D
MAQIKLTKNELRSQELHLAQLSRYLPTLKLKKALLQLEVQGARLELEEQQHAFAEISQKVGDYTGLFEEHISIDVEVAGKVISVQKVYENIAGVEIPHFEGITFHDLQYALFDTPPWVDSAIAMLRAFAEAKARVEIAEEKKNALEEELRQVSIRVNLFEKVLIPRAVENIKKIKVFLGDQQLNAVARAKVAKSKILARSILVKQALAEA